MQFFFALLVQGALSGAVYALIAQAFIVVYKASRLANFALGEWVTLGAALVGVGVAALGLGLGPSLLLAAGGVFCLASIFNRVALRHLAGRPLITGIMLTLGLGTLMRGGMAIGLRDVPHSVPALLPSGFWMLGGVAMPLDRMMAAAVALLAVVAAGLFYRLSRAGLALRALADDPTAAMVSGINPDRYITLAWALAGLYALIAGLLWAMLTGGGFGLALVGLKVFPVVVIGGLDSFEGAIMAALLVGLVESLASGYGDPVLGSGFGALAGLMLLFVALYLRPHGLLGTSRVERI